jgi:HTH-type transcriptional regulator, transcriptional repressor of NAD biosynthesis genes
MKRGLVIGKFMPMHLGHIELIKFAAQHCDELIVSMSETPTDPIPADLRYTWLVNQFHFSPKIVIERVVDDFDHPDLPWPHRSKIWADFLRKRYLKIDVLFSSEDYGEYVSAHLQTTHIMFDKNRNHVPISASKIRGEPFRYWEFIPEIVRPYFVKLICLYGPESTGKSTLAKKLAADYKTHAVPEVAREMITSNRFTVEDIIKIGYAQTERVKDLRKKANKFLFCDTDLITTQIYCRHYLNVIPPILHELEKEICYDQYFLLYPDVPWVADGLRDLGQQRSAMFDVFKSELDSRSIPYHLIDGSWSAREQRVFNAVKERWK